MKNRKLMIADLIVLLLSGLLCLGTKFWFHACGQTEEGKWMACHWAEQAVFAAGIALTVSAVLLLTVRSRRVKGGIALGMLPAAVTAAFVPQHVISLCMMNTMRCHMVMKPAVLVIALLLAAAAAADAALSLRAKEDASA